MAVAGCSRPVASATDALVQQYHIDLEKIVSAASDAEKSKLQTLANLMRVFYEIVSAVPAIIATISIFLSLVRKIYNRGGRATPELSKWKDQLDKLVETLKKERSGEAKMSDIVSVIEAISAGVGLIDKLYDQISAVLKSGNPPSVPAQHRQIISMEGESLVAKSANKVVKEITAAELATKLTPQQQMHIKVLEESMRNNYSIWAAVYPSLALETNPISKAKVSQQLREIIKDMKNDLSAILDFLRKCGFTLDDHYEEIRNLVSQVN